MFKHPLAFLLVLALLTDGFAHAQHVSVFAELPGIGVVSANDIASNPSLSASLASHRQWQAYQGEQSLSEPEFYRLLGLQEEAENAARFQRTNRVAFITGTILMLGAVVHGWAVYDPDDRDAFAAKYIPTYAMIAPAIGFTSVFGPRLRLKRTTFSVSTQAAMQYNGR